MDGNPTVALSVGASTRAGAFGLEHAAKLKLGDQHPTERPHRLKRFCRSVWSSPMLRRIPITAVFVTSAVSFAFAQNSPLPSPRQPEAKAETRQPDPDLAKFRSAYTSGDGIAYVVIKDDKGEHIYRYGDASRLTAKRDTRGYVLFTCAAPHVFVVQRPGDKTALMQAEVVKAGEPRFAELDSKYVSSCRNPMVKSAIPRGKQS
jgi:hypothetical protein